MKNAAKPTGYVVYQGPSLIDGSPIVAIALTKSSNSKTADMIQTYIIRSDMDPRDASKTGADVAICGTCPHRGTATDDPKAKLAKNRSCYVVIGQGPVIVFKGFVAGKYPKAESLATIGKGRMVRIGTYGDGAAVPSSVWNELISEAEGHTGYSHQANTEGAAFNPALYMESVESVTAASLSWSLGRRTFRIVANVNDIIRGSEIVCPATAEGGAKTTCEKCGLCAGNSVKAKSIAVVAHGSGAKYVA
jgi:hypothetical protein